MTPLPKPLPGGRLTSADVAWNKLVPALAGLAIELTSHGQPAPPIGAILALSRAEAVEATIDLVHAVFRLGIVNGALTQAAKKAGNAARRVRRAMSFEEARRARPSRPRARRAPEASPLGAEPRSAQSPGPIMH